MDGLLGWTAVEWSAAGAVGTFLIALVAALAAFRQVKEARTLREEQAQPYVVVYFEISSASSMHVDLVVRNLGQTVARDVRISFDPDLRSTFDKSRPECGGTYFLRHGIPTLPPGMEYRMLFEDGPARFECTDLPRQYRAIVHFSMRRGRREKAEYVLDLDTFYGYQSLALYGEHHSAKALKEIAKTLKGWTAHTDGLRVYGQDDAEVERRWAQAREARRRNAPKTNVERDRTIQVESAESKMIRQLPPTRAMRTPTDSIDDSRDNSK